MAYSKAWRIIKDTEAALDLQLLNRDGAHGSDLTEAGNKLLDTYLAIEEKLQKEAEELFEAASSSPRPFVSFPCLIQRSR